MFVRQGVIIMLPVCASLLDKRLSDSVTVGIKSVKMCQNMVENILRLLL
jgi:hypothetical protein